MAKTYINLKMKA